MHVTIYSACPAFHERITVELETNSSDKLMDWEKREKDGDEAESYLKQRQLAHLTHV